MDGSMKLLFLLLLIPIFLLGDIEYLKNIKGKKIKLNINRDVNKVNLVDIKDFIPDAIVDLQYSKKNRISPKALYQKNICLLNKTLAYKLKKIDLRLKTRYKKRLKFLDCYRPWSIQKMKWKKFHNKKYIYHPSTPSKQNMGIAVSVTLTDITGKELKMPTKFDFFSKKSSHKYRKLKKEEKNNRNLLKNTMSRYGLTYNNNKWWYYALKTNRKYPVLDFTILDYYKKIEEQKKEKLFKNNNKENKDTTSLSFVKSQDNNRDIKSDIKKTVSSIKKDIVNCFIMENNRGVSLPEKVMISYTVRQDGNFYDVIVENQKYKNKKDELNYCILKLFKKIKIDKIPMVRAGKIPLEFSFE
jgi:D-alanyl-D-alanine dipeptidase